MPGVDAQSVAGGGRVCFRGDDREPSVMFGQGFYSRQPNSKIKYNNSSPAPMFISKEHEKTYARHGFQISVGKTLAPNNLSAVQNYRHAVTEGPSPIGQPLALVPRTPDVNLLTAVCITPRFSMAVLFPPKASAGDVKRFSWVYAVYVRELFNTHARQVCEGLQAIKNEVAVRDEIKSQERSAPFGGPALFEAYVEDVALWTLYAQELATKKIEAQDVIFAMKVDRTWKGADFTHGCDYKLLKKTGTFNKGCTVDKTVRKAVKAFFKGEPVFGSTPDRSSGFHKDDENTRSSVSLKMFITSMEDVIAKHKGPVVDDSDSDSEWD